MSTTDIQFDELTVSDDIREDAAALQERADKDGYLFFRGLFDPQEMLKLRKQFTDILQDLGWIREGTDPMEALCDHEPSTEGKEDYWPLFERFQKLEHFHAMAHTPAVLEILERLFGEQVLVHPRNIGRVLLPSTPFTPPHQDYFPIRGSHNTWTVWAPQGDTPRELGGLAVMPGMHKQGLLPTVRMPGAGGSGIEDKDLNANWLTTDFKVGDALMLHCYTPHRSLPNQTEQSRLSIDYRYQPISEQIDVRSLLPHMQRLTWEQTYENWESDKYQYYWKDLDLELSDYLAEAGANSVKGGY